MSENSLPEPFESESETDSEESVEMNFTLADFRTEAVFGESPAKYVPPPSADVSPPTLQPEDFAGIDAPLLSQGETPVNQLLEDTVITPPILRSKISISFCPQCGSRYDSTVNIYCLNDGSLLVKEHSLPETIVPPKQKRIEQQTEPLYLPNSASEVFSQPAENYSQPAENFKFAENTILDNSYRVLEHLGKGGFGDIYAVENIDSYFPEVQVLKLVHNDIVNTYSYQTAADLRDSFRSQYKAWKILSEKEPNFIVRLHDVKLVERRVGILMERMEGGTLLELVESWGGKPQTQEQLQHLTKLFIQASRALNVIHRHKLIHRDIKPQNILLDAKRQKCKLCDFELLDKKTGTDKEIFSEDFVSNTGSSAVGTFAYMSKEAFEGKTSLKSDIFALGVTFYYLLSGEHPFEDFSKGTDSIVRFLMRTTPPKSLTELNPLVSRSLDRLVLWCLELDEDRRPNSVTDLINRLLQLGITDEESNFSPVNLARLLLTHLSPIELDYLVDKLDSRGFRSMSEDREFQRQDMIEEYCFTTAPHDILREHPCGIASLFAIADALKIKRERPSSEDLIKKIVKALGFKPGKKQAHALETIRRDLEGSRIKFEGSETVAECRGHLDHAFAEIERAITLLIGFYGQTLHGKGLKHFLAGKTKGKPIEKLTIGEKVGALRELCTQEPDAPLPERVMRIFRFPLISKEIFDKLSTIVNQRNQVVHNRTEFTDIHTIQNFGQSILQTAVEVIKNLVASAYTPRVVQITSQQIDIYGRHFYEGHDEKGKKEKIFTTQGLDVGQLYWFVPLTNPARINPLIFPFDEIEDDDD
jgi:serine/threonine protein kinase